MLPGVLEVVLTVVVTCLGALTLGQGALALCGAKQWSWLAVPVGTAVMMLVAIPAIHVPGRSATTAVVMAVLIVAGVALMARRPQHRPPITGLLAGLPVALLVFVPFAAVGRVGTLGLSIDNDMAAHLIMAEAYRSAAVAKVIPLSPVYPLGPHALVATFAEGMGLRLDLAFAGLTAALPILLAWTALASVRRVPWLGKVVVATVVGLPFLIAGLYGEGSFKEVMQAQFVLAVALTLDCYKPTRSIRRWIPLGLILAGSISVYSAEGLLWPVLFIVAWLAIRAIARAWQSGSGEAWRQLCVEIVPGIVALAVLVIVLLPQLPRVVRFVEMGSNGGIEKLNLGNLVGPLPGWEAFGIWNNPDFRLPLTSPFAAGMWVTFVFVLVVVGVLWSLRQGRWILPVAAALAMLIWTYSTNDQSPYVAAKALTIASPLLLLLAALPLVQRAVIPSAWLRYATPILALLLLVKVVDSDWEALRYSKVGPTNHLTELRSLRPLVGKQPTLFLGNDDFIYWELSGVHVTPAVYSTLPQVPLRPQEHFTYGDPVSFDAVTSATLDEYDWVITTRDAAASEAPSQMRLVRQTQNYDLWHRVGEVESREVLENGAYGGAILNCTTPASKALLHSGGIAAVRTPSVEMPAPGIPPGGRVTVTLSLTPGTWNLETPYVSPLPMRVSAPGLKTTLVANLDRPGPRFPIGQIVVSRAGPVTVSFETVRYLLTPASDVAVPTSVIATLAGRDRTVPLRDACGKLVDWYRITGKK